MHICADSSESLSPVVIMIADRKSREREREREREGCTQIFSFGLVS